MSKTKICTKCNKRKYLDDFSIKSASKDGRRSYCKSCQNHYQKEYNQLNNKKISDQRKKQRKQNLDLTNKKQRQYYSNNLDKYKNYRKKYHIRHSEYMKNYRKTKKKQIYKKTQEWKNKNYTILKEKRQEKYKNDIEYRLTLILRSRLRHAMDGKLKQEKTKELLGCSVLDLRLHLENQFMDGMNWNNYGKNGWHIDHIKPCASFDLTDPKQQKICFHYTNLQPLWATDNLIKHSKLI